MAAAPPPCQALVTASLQTAGPTVPLPFAASLRLTDELRLALLAAQARGDESTITFSEKGAEISVGGQKFQCAAFPETAGSCSLLRGSFSAGELQEVGAVLR